MKKKLLLGAFLMGSFLTANAQDSCATALTLTEGTTTVGTINGAYGGDCWQTAGDGAEWYSYQATVDGMLKINTNLASNVAPNSIDTRISVFTGTCDALECYMASDDVNPASSGGNYLTDLSFYVEAGVTYYIAFDDRWSDAGFNVEVSMIQPASGMYDYGFETADGWLSDGWNIITNADAGQNVARTGAHFAFSNTQPDAAADAWLFSRAISLEAGETIQVSFYGVYFGAAGSNASLDLTVGTDYETQTVVQSFSVAALTGGTLAYTQYSASYTADEAGIYFFGFHHNSPAIGTAAASLLLDDMSFAGEAGVNDFLASQLSIYPNPASDVINIANTENILVNGVEIVDLNGRVVKSVKFNGVTEAQINISELSSGMYLMNVSSDQGTTTKKIVKK